MSQGALRVAVLGPGGIGGLLAALLARAGDSVLVLAGDSTAQAIAEGGLRVESRIFGNFAVRVDSGTRLDDEVDVCLITVKATQLEAALERIPKESVGRALVIPFLNGLDHVDLLRARYGTKVVPATIRIEVLRAEPGLIRQTSPFAAAEIATSDRVRGPVERFAAHLRTAGLDVKLREDETAMLWDKLALLGPLALLTTHERGNVGVIRARRREDAIALISEVAAVARAEGASPEPEAAIRLLDAAPESFETSMQRDQAAGQPIELDAIGGAVLRHAAAAGVPVPVTTRLVEELRARERARSER
ncbi:MAG: ketopantoate reductase family protein [Candidatus Dormibacteraceae bacterium]